MAHSIRGLIPAQSLAVLTVIFLVCTSGALLADSSVRPPGNAVNVTPVEGPPNTLGTRSDADIWRDVRAGGPGTITTPPPLPDTPGQKGNLFTRIWDEIVTGRGTVTSTTDKGRLVQSVGEDWRLFRRDIILPYSGWIIVGVLALLVLFRLIRGQIKIRGGRAGTTIPRFSMSHRIAHWYLASSFIIMGLTGLFILFGRPLLLPLLARAFSDGTAKDVNAVLLSAALQGHNLFGPVFILALVIMIFRFVKGNFFQWADLKWILKGGGLIGGHASSNHYNFGEKTWYWIVVIVGLIMSATGLLLEFPWLTDVLAWHQLSTILHAAGAILLISIALGHAYIGSIGMEGSLDSMLRGEVDENWAKEHHDLWYEQVTGKSADTKPAAEAAE